MELTERLSHYSRLMRLDKPIGILLLLWPTLWALWLSSEGAPDVEIAFIFVAGVILMRSAGCVMNDVADRKFDGHVKRTRERPLPSGKVTTKEAVILALTLALAAFLLVLFCNALTISLAVIGAGLAVMYPFLKRVTKLPQLGLGLAFTWGVPMAFSAETGGISSAAWLLFVAGVVWTVIYDTMYAMVDRDDDITLGLKSTAILFGSQDRFILGLLQVLFLLLLVMVGMAFNLESAYFAALLVAILLFLYQQWLIKGCLRDRCFAAFLNNSWVGFVIFVGIMLSYMQ